jgi:hypothetical protein
MVAFLPAFSQIYKCKKMQSNIFCSKEGMHVAFWNIGKMAFGKIELCP